MQRSAQFELALSDAPRPSVDRPRPVLVPDAHVPAAPPMALDRVGAWDGVHEVFLTLMATLALGLGWAAIEAGWANTEVRTELSWAGARMNETGYADAERVAP